MGVGRMGGQPENMKRRLLFEFAFIHCQASGVDKALA